ncbi:hypothetical protein D3C75_1322380 [compost metagenome]
MVHDEPVADLHFYRRGGAANHFDHITGFVAFNYRLRLAVLGVMEGLQVADANARGFHTGTL